MCECETEKDWEREREGVLRLASVVVFCPSLSKCQSIPAEKALADVDLMDSREVVPRRTSVFRCDIQVALLETEMREFG